jgi:LmbE family N-acetylglucosaminyl deacetylase
MDFTDILFPIRSLFAPSPIVIKEPVPMTVMILSPHPDDECIVGSLALRLMKENNAHVVNVAVTLGSNKARQKSRLKELENACALLEMELIVLSEDWTKKRKELKSLIQKYQPQIVLAPHLNDQHPTHIKTGKLLKKVVDSKTNFLVAWTEFWGQLGKPNLLIEVPEEILLLQMEALSRHVGEIERNPYHLRLPAWMMDNVRRGSEVIAGKGTTAPTVPYGVLYQLQTVKKGKFRDLKLATPFLSHLADLGEILKF